MKKIIYLIPVLVALLSSCSQSITYTVASPKKTVAPSKSLAADRKNAIAQRNGKCYQNCIVPDRYETVSVKFPIYTGTDSDAPVRVETLIVEPSKNKWEKNSAGEFSLVETPAQTRQVRVLADTIFYKDFRYDSFSCKKLVEKGGFTRETEVVCQEERTPTLFLEISNALKAKGYLDAPTSQWDMKLSMAVQQFQKDHSLPVGALNLETIRYLGM